MRVLCINDYWVSMFSDKEPGPKKGDIDIVVKVDERLGFPAYSFERFGADQFFRASYFVPVSEITIEELIGLEEMETA